MTRTIFYSILYLLFFGATFCTSAHVCAQPQLRHGVIAPGGESSAGALRLYDVVGQSVTGAMSMTSTRHIAGYVAVVERYLYSTPTLVLITAFEAQPFGGRVKLSWTIGSADGLVGYNVYRSEHDETDYVNVAGGFVPASLGSSYEDADVRPGTTYHYRLGAVDADGEVLSRTVSVTTPVLRTELQQNRPNPFNPATTISFYLARSGTVTLNVYDTAGRLVRSLIDQPLEYGAHNIHWDGTNDRGESVSSGVYFYRLRAGTDTFTKKMTLLK